MSRCNPIIAAALATAALAAVPAGAPARPIDNTPSSGAEAAAADRAAAMWRYYRPQHATPRQDLRTPDWRDAAARIRGRQDLRSPDTRDIADGRQYPPTPTVGTLEPPAAPDPASAGGFHWGDAAIGAASAFGLILLTTVGGVVFVRRREHRDQPVAVS